MITMKFERMSVRHLKQLVKETWQSVEVMDCFGTRDQVVMEKASEELDRRGYSVGMAPRKVCFVKRNDYI